MLVAPSDHVIADRPAFLAAIDRAVEALGTGVFVTFGVTPDRPETGYGYLELPTVPTDRAQRSGCRASARSPTPVTAETFLSGGAACGTRACSCSARPT